MSASPSDSSVLSFEDARHMVEQHAARVQVGEADLVDLLEAQGRVLADEVFADSDIPPFPRSTRDGYAVRSADLSRVPAVLESIGEIKAGESVKNIPEIQRGQTVAIMTGAPVPQGADAVVMVEYTSSDSARIEVT